MKEWKEEKIREEKITQIGKQKWNTEERKEFFLLFLFSSFCLSARWAWQQLKLLLMPHTQTVWQFSGSYSSDTLLEHTIITLAQVMCLMAYWPQQLLYETAITSHTHYTYMHICISDLLSDLLSKIWALSANIEFSILSVPVGFQSNSDYCTNVLQGVCTVLY